MTNNEYQKIANKQKRVFLPHWSRIKQNKMTNSLTKAIIRYVQLTGNMAVRTNVSPVVQTRKMNVNGYWKEVVIGRRRATNIGMSDVIACKGGLYVGIEIKSETDKLSDSQLRFKEELIRCGGIYLVVRNFDDFKEQWDALRRSRIEFI